MLIKKNLNGVCLNIIDKNNPFGSDKNEIEFINKNGIYKIEKDDKLIVSFKILELIKSL